MQSNADLPSNDDLLEKLSVIYEKNKTKLEAVNNLNFGSDKDKDAKKKKVIESTLETAKVIGEIAAIISEINPVAKAVTAAYNTIVNRAITQNSNEKKTWIVYLQMQNMMCELFRLREIQKLPMSELDRVKEKAELKALLEVIAIDINRCGSDLDFYSKQNDLLKAWTSPKFQANFQEHMEKFANHRTSLHIHLSAYMCTGISSIGVDVTNIKSNVSDIRGFMGKISEQLSLTELASKKEQEMQSFIDRHGKSNILKTETLLNSLIDIAGESIPGSNNGNKESRKERISRVKTELQKQIQSESAMNDLLDAHYSRFQSILAVQKANDDHMNKFMTGMYALVEGVGAKVGQITSHVLTNVKLQDEEFQRIWSHMKLSRSVKAKTFVLTFRDYYSEIVSKIENLGPPEVVPDAASSYPLDDSQVSPTAMSLETADSTWAVKYIDVTRVQQIVEAMDEDGSGFISVDEANLFALSRPKTISLIAWIAYWAAGWEINLKYYRDEILEIMANMLTYLDYVHPANRSFIEEYLDDDQLKQIEGLLHSISLPGDDQKDPNLYSIAKSIRETEEKRLLGNFETMDYILESSEDVETVIQKSERAEVWILPLLYLLLRRHLQIIQLSTTQIVSFLCIESCTNSLASVYEMFKRRMNKLQDIFGQMHPDIGHQFKKHSYGMFFTTFNKTSCVPGNSTLYLDTGTSIPFNLKETFQSIKSNITVIKGHIETSLDFKQNDTEAPDQPVEGLEGSWTGACSKEANIGDMISIPEEGIFSVKLYSDSPFSQEITGHGSSILSTVSMSGCIASYSPIQVSIIILFEMGNEGISDIRYWCRGLYNPILDSIEGNYVSISPNHITANLNDFPNNEEQALGRKYGKFFMTRTPAYLYRLKANIIYSRLQPKVRARALWKFAIQSVLHMVHPNRWSFFEPSQLGERDKWMQLIIQSQREEEVDMEHYILDYLTMTVLLPPENRAVYTQIAEYLKDKRLDPESFPECNSCGNRILFSRFICITCIDDDFKAPFSLCYGCIDTSIPIHEDPYVHHHSHTLLCSPIRILDFIIRHWVRWAQVLSEDIKDALKFQAAKTEHKAEERGLLAVFKRRIKKEWSSYNEEYEDGESLDLLCACCEMKLFSESLPFWGCIICDTCPLFCDSCNSLNRPYFHEGHSRKHPLIRITSSDNIIISKSPLDIQMERRLEEMEKRITTRIDIRVSSLENDNRAYINSSQRGIETSLPEDGIGSDISSDTSETDMEDAQDGSIPVRNNVVNRSYGSFDAQTSRLRTLPSISKHGDPSAVDFEDKLRKLETKVENRFINLENTINDNFTRLSSLVQMALSDAYLGMQPSNPTSAIDPIATYASRLLDSQVSYPSVEAIQEPSSTIVVNTINNAFNNRDCGEESIEICHREHDSDQEETLEISLMPKREDFNDTRSGYDDPPDEEEESGEPDQEPGDQQRLYSRSNVEEGSPEEDDGPPEDLYTAY